MCACVREETHIQCKLLVFSVVNNFTLYLPSCKVRVQPFGVCGRKTVPVKEKMTRGNQMIKKRRKRNIPPMPYFMMGDLLVARRVTYCYQQVGHCHTNTDL